MWRLREKLDEIRAYFAKRSRQRIMDEADQHEELKKYCRGYDVYPEEITARLTLYVRRELCKAMLVKIFLAASIFMWSHVYNKRLNLYSNIYFIRLAAPLLAIFFLLWIFADFSKLFYFLKGNYDCYGAMISSKRIYYKPNTSTDDEEYDKYYLVSLNGVEMEVSQIQYHKLTVGQYMHFIRLKGKYRKDDYFYFFPCSTSEEQYIIGHQNPRREPRLNRPVPGSPILSMLAGMCITGAFIKFVSAENTLSDESLLFVVGLFAAGIIIKIVNKALSNTKSKKLLEEMRQNGLKD